MSEQLGKHKGAVETLLHEKKELSRLLQIVNSQLERHLGALEEAGVDTDKFIQQIQQQGQQQQGQDKSQGRRQQRGSNQQQGGRQQKNGNQKRKSQKSRSRSVNSQEDKEDVDEFFEEDDEEQDFNPL
jgi:hypothetical protein